MVTTDLRQVRLPKLKPDHGEEIALVSAMTRQTAIALDIEEPQKPGLTGQKPPSLTAEQGNLIPASAGVLLCPAPRQPSLPNAIGTNASGPEPDRI